ncbi:hypothetical protein I4641_09270 [Waterburya agarophytonicola K14]|uniref:Uncharacterized protein n=1 Tax=Waterburya agarophytonicola KI4 TaxID=2874699 RepID=A0A964BS09_9CYAN|nr:hypothetical protein [Waterburya agarophytonicola]MCC0177166.1 hypothetical protein [Waterburya agarophytonicola KI4]
MIYLIVAINLSITLLNIYIAIRIWQLGLLIARITAIAINYEKYFSLAFQAAPVILARGQHNIHQTRQSYQLLQWQIAKVRQIIWLINWSYTTWLKI